MHCLQHPEAELVQQVWGGHALDLDLCLVAGSACGTGHGVKVTRAFNSSCR